MAPVHTPFPKTSVIIANPRSGHGRAETAVRRALQTSKGNAELWLTREPGSATELARKALKEGSVRVISAGGDGTLNEVAQALVGSSACLGILPLGSGNGLARSLGIPLDIEEALELALTAEPLPIDVSYLQGRPFFNIAGMGLDGAVAAAFARQGNKRGLLPYIKHTLQLLARKDPLTLEIRSPFFTWTGEALLAAFATGSQYGGGALIAPDADPRDGLLECMIFTGRATPARLARLPRLFMGEPEGLGGVISFRTPWADICLGQRTPAHVDGEPLDVSGTVRVEVRGQILGAYRPPPRSPRR